MRRAFMARRRRRNGAAFKYTAGDSLAVATFSRASSASYIDSNGVLQTASSGVVRDSHYINGVRTLLLEGQRTNSFLNSGTPATHTSPSLGTGSFTLWMVGTGSIAVAGATATITGAGTATAGTPVTFTVTVAGTVTFTVTGSPTRAQCENGAFASSYIATAGSAVTRSSELLTLPFAVPPQMMTIHVKWVELGTTQIANARLLQIGKVSDNSSPRLVLFSTAPGNVAAFHANSSTSVQSTDSAGVAFGNTVEARLLLNADGSVNQGVSINGAAETLGGVTAANAIAAAWSDTALTIGGLNSVVSGFAAFQSVKIALGVQSLATMRGL